MATVNDLGMLVDNKITPRRYKNIEHGNLKTINGIIVHQTDAPTAQHTFNAYNAGGNGTHFLIGKTGIIYQTASINKRCYHVGRRIKSKCLTLDKSMCNTDTMAKILALSWSKQVAAIDSTERAKAYPHRYPVNSDSIGIELVGSSINKTTYEAVNSLQNSSLQWLVEQLYKLFNLDNGDIYRHPDVSYKNPGEASTAQW